MVHGKNSRIIKISKLFAGKRRCPAVLPKLVEGTGMTDLAKADRNNSQHNVDFPDAADIQIPDLDTIGEGPASFVRTSLMVDDSKYLLIKLLAAFRMEEIRQCLDEALFHFISANKDELRKAVAWYEENEKRKKTRG